MSVLLPQQQLALEVCRMPEVFLRASVFNTRIQETVVAVRGLLHIERRTGTLLEFRTKPTN